MFIVLFMIRFGMYSSYFAVADDVLALTRPNLQGHR